MESQLNHKVINSKRRAKFKTELISLYEICVKARRISIIDLKMHPNP